MILNNPPFLLMDPNGVMLVTVCNHLQTDTKISVTQCMGQGTK